MFFSLYFARSRDNSYRVRCTTILNKPIFFINKGIPKKYKIRPRLYVVCTMYIVYCITIYNA